MKQDNNKNSIKGIKWVYGRRGIGYVGNVENARRGLKTPSHNLFGFRGLKSRTQLEFLFGICHSSAKMFLNQKDF